MKYRNTAHWSISIVKFSTFRVKRKIEDIKIDQCVTRHSTSIAVVISEEFFMRILTSVASITKNGVKWGCDLSSQSGIFEYKIWLEIISKRCTLMTMWTEKQREHFFFFWHYCIENAKWHLGLPIGFKRSMHYVLLGDVMANITAGYFINRA